MSEDGQRAHKAAARAPAGPAPVEINRTWNDAERIAAHRRMTPSERARLAIEASRAALLFAHGERVRE